MNNKEANNLGVMLVRIGERLKSNPDFFTQLEDFINSYEREGQRTNVDSVKIDSLDLFQLIREKSQDEVDHLLAEFSIKELRELLKKYRFGSSSKLKTPTQIRKYIFNQLVQRKTDVFQNMENNKSEKNDKLEKPK